MERFTGDLERGVDVAQTYTCRQIVLDLEPTVFDANRVVLSRKTLGLSQVLFAKFLGVSPKTVRAWEQGTNSPQDIACRLMDEILHDPDYWRGRVSQLARTKKQASC
ncbi:MAG: helix-turn-helix domain-containing protein [Planctomycetota bacterium]|nr:MAG: helix-turn-helix domain-containing protein [Planctomycetota bacterium]